MASTKKTVSAKASKNLRERIENYQQENNFESKTDAVRELWREGLKADEIRQENAQLRQELEDHREKERNSIMLPERLTIVAIAWIALIALADGMGWVSVTLQVGAAELAITLLLLTIGYAVYDRYSRSSD